MNRWNALLVASVGAAVFLLSAGKLQAQANANPPDFMTYQGFLVDGNGNALATNAPKNYDVIFRVWDAPTGGNKLWTEQQTVTVDKGYFSVLLGEGSSTGESRPALNTVFTNATASDRWIGLTVKGIGSGTPPTDVDILPRLRLLTSPYSFLARKAITVDGAGVTSGTVPDARLSANVALRAGGNTFSGNQIFNNSIGIGNTAPADALQIGDFNKGDQYLSIKTAGGNSYRAGIKFRHFSDTGGFNIEDDERGGSNGLNFLRYPFGSPVSALFIDRFNSHVGIGMTAPGFPLSFANTLGDKISLWGTSGNSYGFGIQNNLLQIHTEVSSADIAFGYGSSASMTERMRIKGNGNVGIGTSSPSATLDVNGNLKVSGGITTGSGASTMSGAAPLIVEEKSSNNQSLWNAHQIDLSPWADRPGGFKFRIYAQHELASSDYEVRNYEATVAFEQSGYASNPQFPSQVYRISFSWAGNQGRHSMKLGVPAISNGGGTQEIFPDGWVKITNYIPNSGSGGTANGYSYYGGLNKYVVVSFHPHVSGRIVISDN